MEHPKKPRINQVAGKNCPPQRLGIVQIKVCTRHPVPEIMCFRHARIRP